MITMEKEFISLAGDVTGPSELKLPRSRSLAMALALELIEYARVVECRKYDGVEAVIFDAEIEVPQLRVHPIEEVERIAVVFDEADASHPGFWRYARIFRRCRTCIFMNRNSQGGSVFMRKISRR